MDMHESSGDDHNAMSDVIYLLYKYSILGIF